MKGDPEIELKLKGNFHEVLVSQFRPKAGKTSKTGLVKSGVRLARH